MPGFDPCHGESLAHQEHDTVLGPEVIETFSTSPNPAARCKIPIRIEGLDRYFSVQTQTSLGTYTIEGTVPGRWLNAYCNYWLTSSVFNSKLTKLFIMKNAPFIALILCLAVVASFNIQAQEVYQLPAFNKVKVSPRIALVMEQGTQEKVHFAFENIDQNALNFEVKNGTLEIYLDHARNLEKRRKVRTNYGKVRESIYNDGYVTAFVTFDQINKLVVKGDEDARVTGNLGDETFKLKVYGDVDIAFSELFTDRLKVKMYGDCALTVEAGQAERQKYALFGDHLIDTQYFSGRKVKATSFGDAEFRMNAENLKVTALGIADINCPIGTHLKKFIIGESSVRRFDN